MISVLNNPIKFDMPFNQPNLTLLNLQDMVTEMYNITILWDFLQCTNINIQYREVGVLEAEWLMYWTVVA